MTVLVGRPKRLTMTNSVSSTATKQVLTQPPSKPKITIAVTSDFMMVDPNACAPIRAATVRERIATE
jgi:hypothetical protein